MVHTQWYKEHDGRKQKEVEAYVIEHFKVGTVYSVKHQDYNVVYTITRISDGLIYYIDNRLNEGCRITYREFLQNVADNITSTYEIPTEMWNTIKCMFGIL
jgi:hypothetical protein